MYFQGPIWSHVNENKKKIVKKKKMQKFLKNEKNGLEIRWKVPFYQIWH